VSDRLVRFPDSSWQEIEALPQPAALDGAAYDLSPAGRAGPESRGPFPPRRPLPGAYELHLPADDVTIWYTVTDHEGQEVISVQHVSLDT